jgi:hypothetical protein
MPRFEDLFIEEVMPVVPRANYETKRLQETRSL